MRGHGLLDPGADDVVGLAGLHDVAAADGAPVLVEELFGDADVAREEDEGLAEVHRLALAVGHAAVLQDLKELVHDGGMGLLHLVEQEHREGVGAHGVGELAAGLVAHVARRGSEELLVGGVGGVLGHVEAQVAALVAEQKLGDRLHDLRLARARRAGEEEHAFGLGAR